MGDKYVRQAIMEAIQTLKSEGSLTTIGNIAELLNVKLPEAHMMMGCVIGIENRGIGSFYIDCEAGQYVIRS